MRDVYGRALTSEEIAEVYSIEGSRGSSITRESKVSKRISRWLWLKMLFRVGMYMLLILSGWSAIVWGSFLIAFPLGLIVTGLSLFSIAWALNHVIEDSFHQSADMYIASVFPAGEKVAHKPGILEATAKRTFAEGDPVYADDIIIEHETTENGAGDMVFEFEKVDTVELDPVDQEIDDNLKKE